MSREMQRRPPAAVVRADIAIDAEINNRRVLHARLVERHPRGWWETMVDTRSNLLTRIMRGARRREYAHVGPIQAIGPATWRVEVFRVRDEVPRWCKPAIIAGSVLIALAAIAGLGVWALHATTDALAGKGDAVLAGGVVLAIGALVLAFRRPIVEVIVRVR
jgi:hypothetical protein